MDKEIKFTKNQFETLLKLVYIAKEIIYYDQNHEDNDPAYDELVRFLFDQGKKFGFDHYAKDPLFLKPYTPSIYFLEETDVSEQIDRHEKQLFTNQLIHSLAFSEIYPEKKVKSIRYYNSPEEKRDRENVFYIASLVKWKKEYEKHGLSRIKIKE